MGASGIGDRCARKIWYGFRWSDKPKFEARLLRLFNRGHLEEARFIALLLMIGVKVYQQDETGGQFRIKDADGYFGGSGDGIAIGVPDLPANESALCEFKTSADKPFQKVVKEGVREAKFEHYVQMQIYMRKMGIGNALYMVVNKNNDDLYAEIVPINITVADQFIDRGSQLVATDKPPQRISESASWFECKFCAYLPICHGDKKVEATCRSCVHVCKPGDGVWACANTMGGYEPLNQHEQLAACPNYEALF